MLFIHHVAILLILVLAFSASVYANTRHNTHDAPVLLDQPDAAEKKPKEPELARSNLSLKLPFEIYEPGKDPEVDALIPAHYQRMMTYLLENNDFIDGVYYIIWYAKLDLDEDGQNEIITHMESGPLCPYNRECMCEIYQMQDGKPVLLPAEEFFCLGNIHKPTKMKNGYYVIKLHNSLISHNIHDACEYNYLYEFEYHWDGQQYKLQPPEVEAPETQHYDCDFFINRIKEIENRY